MLYLIVSQNQRTKKSKEARGERKERRKEGGKEGRREGGKDGGKTRKKKTMRMTDFCGTRIPESLEASLYGGEYGMILRPVVPTLPRPQPWWPTLAHKVNFCRFAKGTLSVDGVQ